MNLRNTKIGAWLALIRIQGSPLTPIALLIGYATVANDIITINVLPLVIAGTVAQWGVYVLNDVHDYEYDLDAKDDNKPLVAGDIQLHSARVIGVILLMFSLSLAFIHFPLIAFILFMLALIVGLIYDIRSKTDELRSLYMLVWGVMIIFIGALYAGEYNIYTILTSLTFGIYAMWIIWMDGLKDLGTGQPSIPGRLNAHVYKENGQLYIYGSYLFAILTLAVLSLEGLLLLLIPIIKYVNNPTAYWLTHILVSAVLIIIYMIMTGFNLVYHGKFDRAEFKKDIAKHTSVSVLTMLFIMLSFITLKSIVILVIGSVVWGLMWTKILYNELFYFP